MSNQTEDFSPDRTTSAVPVQTGPLSADQTGPDRLPAGGGLARFMLMGTSGLIAALTFGFSFGNVWSLDLMLGIERHIAPLVGPAVDLSVIGLLVTVQWLALAGTAPGRLRPLRRLLMSCGLVTMALNSAPSLVKGLTSNDPYAYGRAAVEAIAPWLLIAWSHVGPHALRLFVEIRAEHAARLRSIAEAAAATLADRTAATGEGQTGPDTTEAVRTAPPVRRSSPKRTTGPRPPLHAVQSPRMTLEDRIADLDRTYPDRVPSYSEAMTEFGWTSRGETGKAIKELRAQREQTAGPDRTDRSDDDDQENAS